MKADERVKKKGKDAKKTPTNYVNQAKMYLFAYVEKRKIHSKNIGF